MEKIRSNHEDVYVTKPFLPPLGEFMPYLKSIWQSKKLTNNGPFHKEFEKALCDYLGVKFVSLFSNGTMALVTALQALRITGEVITTPFSFVASTHSLWWNNIKPVFVDIDPATFNLDPNLIEAAITPNTTAILPVHVYGNPCAVQRIKDIADAYRLKIIYDACHTFGVTVHGVPVLNFGDLSVISFHATKVFTTFEGGAIICHDAETKRHIDNLKNFGFIEETKVVTPGINAKMNEFQAALGLVQLKHIDKVVEKRRRIALRYRTGLKGIPGLSYLDDFPGITHCYSYFPILIEKGKFGKSRDEMYDKLKNRRIFARRYFYPLISQFPTYRGLESAQSGRLPVAEKMTQEVLCLPIFPELADETIDFIIKTMRK